MGYTDRWNVYTNGPVDVQLDTITPIVGTASLAIVGTPTSGSGGQVNLVPTLTGGLPQPALRGKIRTTIRPLALGTASKIGIAAVQSTRNITTSGSAYVAYVDQTTLVLGKITTGLGGVATVLGSVSFPIPINANYVIELEWNVDVAQLDGVDLYAGVRELSAHYTETGDDEIPTRQIHRIDTTSPLTSTLGQGIMFAMGAGTVVSDFRYDRTRLYTV